MWFIQKKIVWLLTPMLFLVSFLLSSTQTFAQTTPSQDVFYPKVLAVSLNPVEGNRNLLDTYFFNNTPQKAAQGEDANLPSTFDTFRTMTHGVVNYQLA